MGNFKSSAFQVCHFWSTRSGLLLAEKHSQIPRPMTFNIRLNWTSISRSSASLSRKCRSGRAWSSRPRPKDQRTTHIVLHIVLTKGPDRTYDVAPQVVNEVVNEVVIDNVVAIPSELAKDLDNIMPKRTQPDYSQTAYDLCPSGSTCMAFPSPFDISQHSGQGRDLAPQS
jgi:hypothetical protein